MSTDHKIYLGKLLAASDELEQPLISLFQKGWLDYNEKINSFKISAVIQESRDKKSKAFIELCGLVE